MKKKEVVHYCKTPAPFDAQMACGMWLDYIRTRTTENRNNVTCKNCLRVLNKIQTTKKLKV